MTRNLIGIFEMGPFGPRLVYYRHFQLLLFMDLTAYFIWIKSQTIKKEGELGDQITITLS